MFGAVYIAFIIIGQLSITSIIPVTISIRDMYYRHESAGMLSSRSVIAGLLAAEIPFIAVISLAFPIIFVNLIGLPNYDSDNNFWRGFGVYLFFGLNTAIYSYIGECYLSNQLLAQNHISRKLTLSLVFNQVKHFVSWYQARGQQ